ncbi:MAG: radical SAM protein [Proteobacteria bacterium]|nr:radical SAM protein [Pseudomonadota bacterium]
MRRLSTFIMNLKYAFRPNKPLLFPRLVWAVCRSFLPGPPALRYVDFAIDFACNLNCQHCFASSLKQNGRRKMAVEDYKRVARECMDLGVVNFSFQGGEPLMIPDLKAIIAACKPQRNIISVSTNGTLITADRVRELKRWGVDILTISLDSSISEEHDLFRGKAGAYEKTLSGIKTALSNGLGVTLATVVTHQNLREEGISGLLRLAAELKVILYIILPVPAGRWIDNDQMRLTQEDLNYIDSLTENSPYIRTDLQANLGGYGCGAAKEILYMTPYGDVLTCPFLHISPGNIFDETVGVVRQRALRSSWFSEYHPECLASTDKEFIDNYLSKTFGQEQLPLDWDTVFPTEGDDR